jgi:hypothetical protein
MRRLLASSLTLLTFAAGAAGAQEAVLLRLGGTPGQSSKYTTTVETWILGGPMAGMIADTTQPMQQMTMWITRTLTAASTDTLTWTESVDSATAAFPAMPQMAAMASRITDQVHGLTTESRTDRRGHVYSSTITAGPMAGMGGARGGDNSSRTFYALPAQAVRPGDTWHDSTSIGSAEQPGSFVADYKFERIESHAGSRVAVMTMSGRMTAQNPQGAINMQVTGEVRLELGGGRIVAVTMAMRGTSQTQMGDVPMRMRVAMQAL